MIVAGKEALVFEDSTTVIESSCIDCGWTGSESEHHFLDGWHVCPKCHQAEFLVSGDELDEMNESEGVPF